MKYAVIYEKTGTGYSAYAPDLPGCIATGTSLELTKRRMERAVEVHVAAMDADGDPIPEPTTQTDYVETPRPSRRQKRAAFTERISVSVERK
jgi:predicted RNase H-like HicB family nuclease